MNTRESDCDRYGHLWRIHEHTGKTVSCARCYRCLSLERMLAAYLQINTKDRAYP